MTRLIYSYRRRKIKNEECNILRLQRDGLFRQDPDLPGHERSLAVPSRARTTGPRDAVYGDTVAGGGKTDLHHQDSNLWR